MHVIIPRINPKTQNDQDSPDRPSAIPGSFPFYRDFIPRETTEDTIQIHNKVSFEILTNSSPFSRSVLPLADPSTPATSESSDSS